MPPYAFEQAYSSLLDGSLRVEKSSTSAKYGNGSLAVENGCNFFGDTAQHISTTHASADFYIESAKNIYVAAATGSAAVTAATTLLLSATTGNVTASGTTANLTATTGAVSVDGVTSASLTSSAGGVQVSGATSASVISTTGPVSLSATSGDATVQASGNVYLSGAIKQETFTSINAAATGAHVIRSIGGFATLLASASEAQVFGKTLAHLRGNDAVKVESVVGDATVQALSGKVILKAVSKEETFTGGVTATSVSDYNVSSSAGDVKLQSENNQVKLFGKTLAHVRGDNSVKIESGAGDINLTGFTRVDVTAPTISLTGTNISSIGTTSVNLVAPAIDLNGGATSRIDATTVNVGNTSSDTVNISRTGKSTNVLGNLAVSGTSTLTGDASMSNVTINGNLTVIGTTTTIDTANLLVKDNIIVLNTGSATGAPRDAGLLFTRAPGEDSTTMYWDETADTFVLASTKSAQDQAQIVREDYSKLRCKSIIAESMTLNNFGTFTFTLDGNSHTPHADFTELTKTRGSYEFQIESTAAGGSVYNYKVVKATSTATAASFGVHAAGDDGSQVWVQWLSGGKPTFYMKTLTGVAGTLEFKVTFTTV